MEKLCVLSLCIDMKQTTSKELRVIMSDKKILVVDDNQELRELIEDHLKYLGIQVQSAENIGQAKQMIQDEFRRFDVIISDLNFPKGESGLELVAWTRKLENSFKAKSRFILMTGYHSAFDDEVARKYGVNQFLTKPFDPSFLEEQLHLLFLSMDPKAA